MKKSQGVPDMRGERDCQGPLQCPGTSSSECPGVEPREENENIWLNLPSHPSF